LEEDIMINQSSLTSSYGHLQLKKVQTKNQSSKSHIKAL